MAEFNNRPLPRHDALAPLSRDHYVGLVQARHLIRGSKGDEIVRRGVVAEFLDAWRDDVAVHFRDEERLLLPHMDEADRERLIGEHRSLSTLALQVYEERKKVAPDPALLLKLGEELERHIRWEERDLFGRLQATLGEEVLAELEHSTEALEETRHRDVSRSKS